MNQITTFCFHQLLTWLWLRIVKCHYAYTILLDNHNCKWNIYQCAYRSMMDFHIWLPGGHKPLALCQRGQPSCMMMIMMMMIIIIISSSSIITITIIIIIIIMRSTYLYNHPVYLYLTCLVNFAIFCETRRLRLLQNRSRHTLPAKWF